VVGQFHLTWVFHALTQSAYGTHSGLPLSQVAIGVFHSLIVLKYAIGAFAWYRSQEPYCIWFMIGHASLLSGVSP
jgi:hypothetical protein